MPVVETWDGRARKGARLDMSSAFGPAVTAAERSVWLDRKNHLHVEDRIAASSEDIEVQWIMTTSADAEIISGNQILLEEDGRRMVLNVQDNSLEDLQMHIWSNEPRHDYDAPNPGTRRVGFTMTVPADCKAILKVRLIPEA